MKGIPAPVQATPITNAEARDSVDIHLNWFIGILNFKNYNIIMKDIKGSINPKSWVYDHFSWLSLDF